MRIPPTMGPRPIGILRTKEWSKAPKLRFSMGTAAETRLMTAGREIAVQEMKNTVPMRTAAMRDEVTRMCRIRTPL
jgi:hypothetical protein